MLTTLDPLHHLLGRLLIASQDGIRKYLLELFDNIRRHHDAHLGRDPFWSWLGWCVREKVAELEKDYAPTNLTLTVFA